MKEEISLLKSLLLGVSARLQVVEVKNKVLESENQELRHEMKNISTRQNVEAKNQEQSILNKLRHEMKNITDDFSKHVTSSEIHFGVIEELYDDHIIRSDNNFEEINQNISQIEQSLGQNISQIEQSLGDHVKNSDSQFSEIQENLSDIKVSSKANT